MLRVLYTAAHAVAASEAFPLGGGAAICRQLAAAWHADPRFDLRILGPDLLGAQAPTGASLVRYSERDYARFCHAFSHAATEAILREDPASSVVLINDVSEGPDWERLARAGFPLLTIYHVDVVAYVAAIYGRGLLRPATTVRWWNRLRHLPWPSMMRLVWDKQHASVRHSQHLIVPSAGMRDVLLECYPEAAGKVRVIPWGAPPTPPAAPSAAANLRAELGIPPDAFVLLTLSRLSPEKGQDLLLQAIAEWETRPDFPTRPVVVAICGEAAYMMGARHRDRLQALAARLRKTRVLFPGHVTGDRKAAFFALADAYVFPSRHESYGLTLLEALQAGLPAICLDHLGARAVMREEFGVLASGPAGLIDGMARLERDHEFRHAAAAAARRFAATQGFATAANHIATLLTTVHRNPVLA